MGETKFTHEGCGIETSFIEPDSQAVCPGCDWKGPWRPSELEAAQDLKEHFAKAEGR